MSHQSNWTLYQEFASRTVNAVPVIETIIEKLRSENWSSRDIFGIHLAVEEAVVNAVTHGNHEDEEKVVNVACQIRPDHFSIEVIDEGRGFDARKVPDPRSVARLDMEHGRGVLLMNAMMDRVEYLGRGNHLVLEKRRTGCDLSEVSAVELALPEA